jgi:hypothetical protein
MRALSHWRSLLWRHKHQPSVQRSAGVDTPHHDITGGIERQVNLRIPYSAGYTPQSGFYQNWCAAFLPAEADSSSASGVEWRSTSASVAF